MTQPSSAELVLGTVQLGQVYGMANRTGQPDQTTAVAIVRTAWENGVREFDTAQDYGTSESVLGRAFSEVGIGPFAKVISKIDPGIAHDDSRAMSAALDRSLQRLGIPNLYGLMLHNEKLLSQWSNGLGDTLEGFIQSGRVKKIGISVYSPKRALEALHYDAIDLIQVPTNILDRRFENAGFFELAAKENKQVYIRSVFLQGLILMDAGDLPSGMLLAKPFLNEIQSVCDYLNLSRHELAIGYLREKVPGAKLIIGAETPEQIADNLKYSSRKIPRNLLSIVAERFNAVHEKVVNPLYWNS